MNADRQRRLLLTQAAAGLALLAGAGAAQSTGPDSPSGAAQRRWFDAALRMQQLALSWGDQPYGAVLVLNQAIVGDGPSRVVRNNDPEAHAEREAIRDAQRRLGRASLAGSILYSTARPCRACEAAAARAGVARMVFGPELRDAGAPTPG